MKYVYLIVACAVLCCACVREVPEPAGVTISIANDGEWGSVKDV